MGNNQLLAGLVSAGAVTDQEAMRAGGNVRADFYQMFALGLGVDGRHDHCGPNIADRTDHTLAW